MHGTRARVQVDRLKHEAMAALAALDRERQASAAGLRSMRTSHARSVTQLHALVTSGEETMVASEKSFLQARTPSQSLTPPQPPLSQPCPSPNLKSPNPDRNPDPNPNPRP